MAEIIEAFGKTFREYETDGVRGSGPHDVSKTEAQALGGLIEIRIAAAAAAVAGDGIDEIVAAIQPIADETNVAAERTLQLVESLNHAVTFGTVTPNDESIGNPQVAICCAQPLPFDGVVPRVRIATAVAQDGVVTIRRPLGGRNYQVDLVVPVSLEVGVNEINLPLTRFARGSFVAYTNTSGGLGILYDESGPYVRFIDATAPAVGDQKLVTFDGTPATPAIAYDFFPVDDRHPLDVIEVVTRVVPIGTLEPNSLPVGNNKVEICCATATPVAGLVPRASVKVRTGGIGAIIVRSPAGDQYSVASIQIFKAKAGLNVIDLPLLQFPRGSYVSYLNVLAAPAEYDASGAYLYFLHAEESSPPAVGSTYPLHIEAGATPALLFEFIAVSGANQEAALSRTQIDGPTYPAVIPYYPTTVPPGWSMGGNIAFNTQGFYAGGGSAATLADATGNFNQAIFLTPACTQHRVIEGRFAVGTKNTCFLMGVRPDNFVEADGAFVFADGVNGVLSIYSYKYDGTYVLAATAPLSDVFTADHEYRLEIEYEYLRTTAILTDSCSQTKTTVSYLFDDTGKRPTWHGQPVVAAMGGSVCIAARFGVPGGQRKRVLVVGDSITEGSGRANCAPSWAALLAEGRDDVVVEARAGANSAQMLPFLKSALTLYRPDYVVLALGTNDDVDGSVTQTRGWTRDLVEAVLATGSQPVMVTIAPMPPGYEAYRNAVNADRLNGYWGRFPVIDFAAALTVNNDRQTWVPAYNSGDNNHPSTAGEAVMYEQVKIDAPFLFVEDD